ncbi:hypothetical protein ZYGR_0AL01400 [Zygosaccharomyces rouxii]|uniref:Uncharacterized protein n=1 Tax=Zygosaccharomyces rouxii TaxID=4956 RepID=A0A1Q3AFC9_ZYGRO|nr:hypothetical protein ZYGR_0AL01400 [Zygosaccharomyces rouxii]
MYSTLPGGVILVFVLIFLAGCAIVATFIYRKWQARKRALEGF